MEIQANALAPYELISTKMLRIRLDELLQTYSLLYPGDSLDYTEMLIRDIANTFGISNYSARKRLIDIGFTLVNWTFVYGDGNYERPYAY